MMPITFVPQRGETDCMIACLAMATAKPYDAVQRDFSSHWREIQDEGMGDDDFYQYLAQHGYMVQTFKETYEPTRGKRSPWPLTPFAPVHVVGVMYQGDEHGVVMDSQGIVFDPYDRTKIGLHEYDSVFEIVGIWKR